MRNIGVNSGSDLLQKKSMQLRDRANRLEATLRPVHAERSGEIRLVSRDTHAKVLAAIRDLTVTTPDGQPLFRIAKLDIRQGDRLVLLGRNGVGKTQLIRLLRRAMAEPVPGVPDQPQPGPRLCRSGHGAPPGRPDAARFHRGTAGHQRRPGHQPARQRGSRHRGAVTPDRPTLARAEGAARPVGSAPGGADFYLLDEPTNHIDIPGQEQLEAELLAQGATCVLVSHDRSFVEAVGTRFLLIEGGQVREVDG